MQPYTLLWLALSNAEAGSGSHFLTDASGLEYMMYGGAGEFSEANYTAPVAASTVSGGTTSMFLSDAFDGYGDIRVDGTRYTGDGSATLDCGDRQLIFGTQTSGDLSFWRTAYVPEDDTFARMVVFVSNDGAKDISASVGFAGDIGSDGGTVVMADSSGDASVDLKDNWAVSKQDFTHTSTLYDDPRLGHLWQNGVGSAVADEITLDDFNDQVHWRFTVTVRAGDTIAIVTFVTGQPTVAAAQLQVETLIGMPDAAVECMTKDEVASIVNFGVDCSHLDDQCNDGTYDYDLEACVATPANEAGKCDDGDTCTLDDVCGAGTCAGTLPAEVTGDGVDEDCDGGEICFKDADDDGHTAKGGATVVSADADCEDAGEATASDPADDCDDDNPDAYPGATETANDDVDQDCDGKDLVEKADDSGVDDSGGGGGDDAGGDNGDGSGDTDDDGGCSCAAGRGPAPLSALALLGIVGLVVRRRR